jgi:hypothetical protein
MQQPPVSSADTFSDGMLSLCRRAPLVLGGLVPRVQAFVQSRLCPDGGFRGRGEQSDLYYTSFGIECMLALAMPLPVADLRRFVDRHGDGEGLDLVHLSCLARCLLRLHGSALDPARQRRLIQRIEAYRSLDGGYSTVAAAPHLSVTGSFLALVALHDLGVPPPAASPFVEAMPALRSADGAYANTEMLEVGTTLAVAGVQTLVHWLGDPGEADTADWLLAQRGSDGGFLASPLTPMSDLLSTATVLYALRQQQVDLTDLAEGVMEFVDGLMEPCGGYGGTWFDDTADVEYSYYALMVQGCLAGSGSHACAI